MFLTHEQLVELTHYSQHRLQAKACGQMGVPYRVRPDGSVAVATSIFDNPKQLATIRHTDTPKMRLQTWDTKHSYRRASTKSTAPTS